MSKVTFEVEGIRITVEKEDQPMFGYHGGCRQTGDFQNRGQFSSNFTRKPPYQSEGEWGADVRRPYYTNPYPSQEDWRLAANERYGKRTTGEPLFTDNVTGKPLNYREAFERIYPQAADAEKAKAEARKELDAMAAKDKDIKVSPKSGITTQDYEGDVATPIDKLRDAFAPNASMPTIKADQADPFFNRRMQLDAMADAAWDHDDINTSIKRPNQFMPAMVDIDRVEVAIAPLVENNDEHFHLIAAYDKIKHAVACFIGKYIFSGEAVDLPFTQTDRGDYALLLPVPYLSMDILLYVDMVEIDGKHYATAINFDYQADIEGEDEDTPVEQSAKDYILSTLKSYIVSRRARQYRQMVAQQPSTNPNAEGHEDGNNQPTGEAPTTQQKDPF